MGQDMETVAKDMNTDVKELCTKYSWYAGSYPPAIQKASDEFFLEGLQFILLGVCKNINTFSDKDAYFVTKVRIDEMHDMFFRLSEKAVGLLLEKAIGKPDTRFNLNKLTDLEAKIITSFNDFAYHFISKFLAPAPPVLKRTNFDVINLTFLVKDIEQGTLGKFVVTLPDVLLAPDVVTCEEEKFTNEDFYDSSLSVNIRVGTIKISVHNLKRIEEGDLVIFDESDISKMLLKYKDYEKEIKINPNTELVLPYEYNGGGDDEMADNVNLWDSIEVELNAEFNPVKITLGELKKIEEGLVMDLTSIYENKITLSVEDKLIARGELVIVNDRYGVKVNEVVAGASKNIPIPEAAEETEQNEEVQAEAQDVETGETAPQGEVQPAQASEEDEFDYSDFELEDEDI